MNLLFPDSIEKETYGGMEKRIRPTAAVCVEVVAQRVVPCLI
jgi:hypothetical protein